MIPVQMYQKYRHFLLKYSTQEWSGPAWYSIEKDEDGFPETATLEYFHVLDLGTKTATDWDGKDLLKVYKDLVKVYPKIGSEWIQGNIHSHNDMGAFFSGTDRQQLIDGSNKNFYFSLVVSYKENKELAFAVSYPDQFNQTIIQSIDDIEEEQIELTTEYESEEKAIETAERSISYRPHNVNQRSLFTQIQEEDDELINGLWDDVDENDEDVDAWNASFGVTKSLDDKDEFNTLQVAFMEGHIAEDKFKKYCKALGVDQYGRKLK